MNRTAAEWGAEYQRLLEDYEDFAGLTHDLITRVLSRLDIDVAHIEYRVKTVESFVEKIARKDKYEDPLNEITDLVGLRIIVYSPQDCIAVGELIQDEFRVEERNSPRWSAELDPERFGYTSDHYIVRIADSRCDLSEYQRFAMYTAEIQVRTVMQHAWAAVDHKIRYKGPDLPKSLRRQLFRLSALVELADQEFAALLAGGSEIKEEYAKSVSAGEYAVGIDALSLSAYLDATGADRKWADIAIQIGYNQPAVDRLDTTILLRTMEQLEIGQLSDFRETLSAADVWGTDALESILRITLAGRTATDMFAGIRAYRDDVLNLLLLVGGKSKVAVNQSPFRVDIQEALLQIIASIDVTE